MIDCLKVEKKYMLEAFRRIDEQVASNYIGRMGASAAKTRLLARQREIKELTHRYFLNESSLSRIYRHISGESAATSWGTLSAYRYIYSDEENEERGRALKQDLRDLGLGFVDMEGGWRECQATRKDPKTGKQVTVPYDECPEDQLKASVEQSLFVPNITRDQIEQLRDKYDQDGVIYGDRSTGGDALLLKNDRSVENLGQFGAESAERILAQGYSKIRNRPGQTRSNRFVFRDRKSAPPPAGLRRGGSFATSTVGTDRTPPTQDTKSTIRQMYNDTIVNPQTKNSIKLKTALGYGKDHPVHKVAMDYIRQKLSEKGPGTDKDNDGGEDKRKK
jgi:hypothetical protein